MDQTRHAGVWTIEDRCESTWQYVPLHVRDGTSALRVELDYDVSGAVLDLGCFGPGGFRGWSGAARRSFVIASKSATPGYLPGELEPGTWLAAIGLHKIPADGARYELTVQTSGRLAPDVRNELVPPVHDRPPGRDLPAARGMRWLAGDLHAHTVHSDGVMTV